jgi:hypothetical protein
MVVAMAALFVALSGAAYAAVAKNSVGAKQIKSNAVRTSELQDGGVGAADLGDNSVGRPELQDNAVGSGEVEDGSLNSGDVGDGSLNSDDVADGSLGSADVADESLNGDDVQDQSLTSPDVARLTGEDVTPGTFLGGNITVEFTQSGADLANGAEVSVDAQCPAGTTGIGGGVRGDLTNSELTKVTASRPVISSSNSGGPADGGTFSGWRGTFVNENNGAGIRPETWVICAAMP